MTASHQSKIESDRNRLNKLSLIIKFDANIVKKKKNNQKAHLSTLFRQKTDSLTENKIVFCWPLQLSLKTT